MFAGVEYSFRPCKISMGITRNLAGGDIGNIYKIGVGIRSKFIQLDLLGGLSNQKTTRAKTDKRYPSDIIGIVKGTVYTIPSVLRRNK